MKKLNAIFIIYLCILTPVLAQNYSTCDQWGSWQTNGYTIYNNIWGSGAGSQCLWAYSPSNWGVTANHPTSGGIKSYPNVDYDVNYSVGSMPNITASFNLSRPSSGSYNSAFDIWYNNYAYEVMLWMNWAGAMGPISYNYGCNGYPSSACPVATNVNIGGHTWNLYEGTNGSATVYSFLRTSNTNAATVNITQMSQWLASNGYFSSNTNIHEIQFGFEITSASNGNFTVNSYSLNIGNGGGGGSSYIRLQNRNTGIYLDGLGQTSNGADAYQWAGSSSYNQQWEVISSGSYIKLRNRATGLYLDGMGRTSNGSNVGQWSNSSSYNQQWAQEQSGAYIRYRNRATGLYLDGMGRNNNGAIVGQWSGSSHPNQQWLVSNAASNAKIASVMDIELSDNQIYPNPAHQGEDLHVAFDHEVKQATVQILDVRGNLLMESEAQFTRELVVEQKLRTGLYLLQVTTDDHKMVKKIIVE
ncbi:RICIN domain-containing protein [Fulvivirga ligni]|uniref:RICIN domain-containing protein n=1 Tax=Fulvivirga ligni TaxID=2904246 RepID=UPI001F17A487|nr:RICIN domain-containing protein [Fulvivirga ligni]UII19670.1 RICIN domain-containing protein [Fulvivirga ligni]